MPVDFTSALNIDERTRKALEQEMVDIEWANLGRVIHHNMVSNRFEIALQTALLGGGGPKAVTRRITAFLLTGTITK